MSANFLRLGHNNKNPNLLLKSSDFYCLVRPGRLELPSHCWHMDLNHARLPIPPRAHILNFKLLAFTQAVFVYSLKKGSRT